MIVIWLSERCDVDVKDMQFEFSCSSIGVNVESREACPRATLPFSLCADTKRTSSAGVAEKRETQRGALSDRL